MTGHDLIAELQKLSSDELDLTVAYPTLPVTPLQNLEATAVKVAPADFGLLIQIS